MVVGVADGVRVGAAVGVALGATVGARVVGAAVGACVGSAVGCAVGCAGLRSAADAGAKPCTHAASAATVTRRSESIVGLARLGEEGAELMFAEAEPQPQKGIPELDCPSSFD